jgi:hypothetical protein
VEQQPRIHNLCVRMAVDKTAKVFGIILRELRSAAGLSQENHARTFTSYQQDGDYSPPRGRRPLLHAVPWWTRSLWKCFRNFDPNGRLITRCRFLRQVVEP